MNKQVKFKLSGVFLSFFLFLLCTAQQKQLPLAVNGDDNSLLWQVSGKGLKQNSYLFGTFHLMCKEDIHFSEQLKTAIANVAAVYMELDMDDPSMLLGGLMMMKMKDGKKLKDLLSSPQYEKVNAFFKDTLQMPLAFMETIKPYFLIAMMYPEMMPCKTTSGIEEELVKLTKQQNKEIKGLETMAFQAAVFDSIPYETQAKELLKSIDSFAAYKTYFDTMLAVYKNQQLNQIESLFNDKNFSMEDYQDVLLDNRNKNWATQLKKIMKEKGVFVAVGAGHLPGKNGLIALLRKQGYKVKPLMNK